MVSMAGVQPPPPALGISAKGPFRPIADGQGQGLDGLHCSVSGPSPPSERAAGVGQHRPFSEGLGSSLERPLNPP